MGAITLLLRARGTRVRRVVAVLFMVALAATSLAAHSAMVMNAETTHELPYEYLIDTKGTLQADEIADMPGTRFTESTGILRLGFVESPVWLRLVVPADALPDPRPWLTVSPPYLDRVTVYQRPHNVEASFEALTLGDRVPTKDRPVKHHQLVFPLEPAQGKDQQLLIRIETTSSVMVDARLWSPAVLVNATVSNNLFWGGYFALAAASTVLALAIGWVSRNRALLAVAAYGVAYILVAGIQGYLPLIMPTAMTRFADPLVGLSLLSGYAAVVWVGREILDLRRLRPRLDRVARVVIWVALAATVTIPLDLYQASGPLVMALGESLKLAMCLSVIAAARREGLRYSLLLSAFAIHSLTTASSVAIALGLWHPPTPMFYEAWQYTLIAMMLIIAALLVNGVYQRAFLAEKQVMLERDLERAREAGFRQRQFVAMLAHEFRNPLALIDAATRNLLHAPGADRADQGPRIERIQQSVARMTRLVDNCLADARIASDRLLGELAPVDALAAVEEASAVASAPEQNSIGVRLTPRAQTLDRSALMINADPPLLQIALSNLLDNAIKFSSDKWADVEIDADESNILIQIWNRGASITADEEDRVFERFFRGANVKSDTQGSGLGLFVAARLIQAHGGSIRLSTNDGRTTAFTLEIPRMAEQAGD